jgi:hypothetical protein
MAETLYNPVVVEMKITKTYFRRLFFLEYETKKLTLLILQFDLCVFSLLPIDVHTQIRKQYSQF